MASIVVQRMSYCRVEPSSQGPEVAHVAGLHGLDDGLEIGALAGLVVLVVEDQAAQGREARVDVEEEELAFLGHEIVDDAVSLVGVRGVGRDDDGPGVGVGEDGGLVAAEGGFMMKPVFISGAAPWANGMNSGHM
jgi:hypothetical protein